jgi:hypothetical protein
MEQKYRFVAILRDIIGYNFTGHSLFYVLKHLELAKKSTFKFQARTSFMDEFFLHFK